MDLDAFFASVEELDNPEWKGSPLVVGADPKMGLGRGVVTTANYAARKYGIKSAMPISEAWRRCPTARFVRGHYPRYTEKSREVFDILQEATDVIERAGIDEAYLDLSDKVDTFDEAVNLARDFQARIEAATGLTASFGMATSKTVAKIASDYRKPRGITAVTPGTEATFLAPLAARRIPGVGPKTEARLEELGIETCADLAALSGTRMGELFGSWGPRLAELARGIDDSPLLVAWERKSLGNETTYAQDVDDPRVWESTLNALAEESAETLQKEGVVARTITIKVRVTGFETYTRGRSLPVPVCEKDAIARVALDLLRENAPDKPVRLLGLRLTGLAAVVRGQSTLRAWPADVLGELEPWIAPQRRVDDW